MKALGLSLDTLEALAEGALRPQAHAVLDALWQRAYEGERIDDALVSDESGAMLAPALCVRATGRGGQYPLMVWGPHWRLFVGAEKGRARLVLGAEYLSRVDGLDARIECERIAEWLFGEGIAWRVSRLDVCTDVEGVGVFAFADLDTCVTRSATASVVFDDAERVDEASVDVVAARTKSRHREVQTITFGSASSRLQCCIYDKRAEARASGKTWALDAARERGWDGASALTRIEFRARGRALDEFPELALRSLDVLERVDEWAPRFWKYATTRAVRYVVPESDSNRSRWDELTAEWAIVAALAECERAVVRVRSVSESVREERMRRASRDVVRGAIALCVESRRGAHDARTRLARIADGESGDAPELSLLAVAFALHGDLVGARALDVRDVAERARELRSRVDAKARLRGYTDEPELALLRAA